MKTSPGQYHFRNLLQHKKDLEVKTKDLETKLGLDNIEKRLLNNSNSRDSKIKSEKNLINFLQKCFRDFLVCF